MALELKKPYKSIDVEYWKILRVIVEYRNINSDEMQTTKVDIEVAAYEKKSARTDNINNYFFLKIFSFKEVSVDRESLYIALKTLPFFEGADDI